MHLCALPYLFDVFKDFMVIALGTTTRFGESLINDIQSIVFLANLAEINEQIFQF